MKLDLWYVAEWYAALASSTATDSSITAHITEDVRTNAWETLGRGFISIPNNFSCINFFNVGADDSEVKNAFKN